MGSQPRRLAVVTSHPIQYQGPLWRRIHEHPDIELTALFCCDHGQKPTHDRDFNTTFSWERPITEGYPHEFIPSVHPHPSPYGFWPLTNPKLWTRLTRDDFDAVLLIGWAFASCWLALGAARAHGLKVLLRGESGVEGYHERPPWKSKVRDIALEAIFRSVDAFLTIGSRNAELYRAFGVPDEKLFLTPYAVDNAYFLAKADELASRRSELRSALGVNDDRPIVMTSGKLIERKAPLDLLRAFAEVRPKRPSKLVFLGDGPLRGEVETEARRAGVADDVLVTGFKDQGVLGEVYGAADLFAFPTRFETWGLVLNEAMLFGLPAICTDRVPGADDLIVAGESGHVYPAGDVAALARLLDEYLADPGRLRSMGQAALEKIRHWDLDRDVEGVAAALDYVFR